MRVLIFSILILFLPACSSSQSSTKPYRDYARIRYMPTFEIDDVRDGIFPNKSPRVGEKAYPYRSRVGWTRKYDDGFSFWIEGGPENQHVGTIEGGIEIPLP